MALYKLCPTKLKGLTFKLSQGTWAGIKAADQAIDLVCSCLKRAISFLGLNFFCITNAFDGLGPGLACLKGPSYKKALQKLRCQLGQPVVQRLCIIERINGY